ncbi:MAG: universal stress protein [Bacteroidales bacterium]
MKDLEKLIVVPWDFTVVAENALAHAAKIARMVNNEVCLLHIVDKKIKGTEETEKKLKLEKIAQESTAKYGIPVSCHISKGSIFTEISAFANDKNANLVLMGTHGMKGMQKLTGSWALKVIVKSKVPFIVVQDPPADMEKYHSIVFPIDYRKENKEKMKMALFLGNYFNSKVLILKAVSSDKALIKKTDINLNFAIKYLIQNNVEYEIHEIDKGNFAQQTIDFSIKMKADLIVIMTTKNITFFDFVIGADEQYIIANSSKIPVCCVNPKSSFAKVGQFMGGWGD